MVEDGKLEIRILEKEHRWQVLVKDSGKGVQTQDLEALLHQGVGLSNTHRRLLRRYGDGVHLEKKLNPQLFIRVHRSSIININYVKEVFKHPGSYDIVMINQDVVRVSRSYLDNIKKLTF